LLLGERKAGAAGQARDLGLREFNSRSVHPSCVGELEMGDWAMPDRLSLAFMLLILAFSSMDASSAPRTDPQTGRVRVLFLGEVASDNALFLGWIATDPQFVMTRVPLSTEHISMTEALRFARIYLPRSEEALWTRYDVTVFEDFTPVVIPASLFEWIQSSASRGMGIELIELVNWVGIGNDIERWMALDFYRVFPAEVVLNDVGAQFGRTYYKVLNPDGPLSLPGIESVPLNRGHHGDMIPRPGSTTEAIWSGRQTPCMVTSTYGEGRTLHLGHGWDNIPDEPRVHYEFLIDYIFNQLFYIAELAYPEDLPLVHRIRTMFVSFEDRRRGTLGVVDFVERFGANPTKALQLLDSAELGLQSASSMYLSGRYEEAADTLDDLLDQFPGIDEELMRSKSRALLWVYAVEWISVLGVSMVCGSSLWILMVRRRLYRGVSVTRAF